MSLESFVAGIENKLKKDFTEDTKGLKYQLKAKQNSGRILKTAKRKQDMFIVVEENEKNRILAGFIFDNGKCRFQVYSNGGIDIGFGNFEDLILYKRCNSIHAISKNHNRVDFYEEDDVLKYDYYTENSSGRGLL